MGILKKTGLYDGAGSEAENGFGKKKGGGGKPQLYDKEDGEYVDEPKFEKAIGFANKERKNTSHHKQHAQEMGYKNQDEYERAGVNFFNSDRGKLYYGKQRNDFIVTTKRHVNWLCRAVECSIHFISVQKRNLKI